MQETLKILIPIVGAHVLVLGAIIFVIKRLLLSDTMHAVNRIKQVEAEVRKREDAIKKEIDEHEKEFTRKKAAAEEEMAKRRQESEKELAQQRDQIVADAKREGDKIIDQAKKNEQKLRQQIAQNMEEKAVQYGAEVFRLVFSEQMNQELNKQFINELLDALEGIDSASITVDASDAEFTSSHPIHPDQKARLQKLLADKFGVNIEIQEKIREELMGGLIFKLGSLEIDGSLLNRYQEAATEVKKSANI